MNRAALPRPVVLTTVAVALGVVATLVVVLSPDLRLVYRSEPAHLVLETCDAGIAAVVAVLFYGRFRRSGRLADLLLGYAAGLLSVGSMGFATIPLLAGADQRDAVTTWAPLVVRLGGAALFAAAALPAPARLPGRRPGAGAAWLAAATAAILVVSLSAPHVLPVAVDPRLDPGNSVRPQFGGHPGVLVAEALDLLCYAVACVAFTRRAVSTRDEFTAWVGAGAGMSAMARVNYLLFPSLFTEYLYVGDILRTAFYVILLIGAARELQAYWAELSEAAVLEERQRLARDLHDGLTQELTYIWSQLQRVAHGGATPDVLPKVTSASERALDEARRAIAALTRPMDEPLTHTLTQAAEEVAGRYDATVGLDLDEVTVDTARRESMVRIVREAVGNAVRHGGVRQVHVRLAAGSAVELTIADAGRGFDYADVLGRRSGYGLTTMRQRAESTGGRFTLCTSPGEGTTVSVVWDE